MLVFFSAITLTECHDLKLIMLSVNKSSLFKIIINVFSGVRGARSLVFCIVFCRLLFVCSFSFGHYPLWYLLTFLQSEV